MWKIMLEDIRLTKDGLLGALIFFGVSVCLVAAMGAVLVVYGVVAALIFGLTKDQASLVVEISLWGVIGGALLVNWVLSARDRAKRLNK